jgi:hypothetical protein
MTRFTLKAGLVGAIALAALAPSALASGVSITTDRVQLQVGDNGQVTIRTLADRFSDLSPLGASSFTAPAGTLRLPTPAAPARPARPGCTARSQSSHSTRSTPAGSVIYSENRSTTRVCQ